MTEVEAIKTYLETADPNHWLTKELQKCLPKNKVPHWAVKELVKKGLLDSSFMFEKQPKQQEIDFTAAKVETVGDVWDEIQWNRVNKKWILPEGLKLDRLPAGAQFMTVMFGLPPFEDGVFQLLGPLKEVYSWKELSQCWELECNQQDQKKQAIKRFAYQESK